MQSNKSIAVSKYLLGRTKEQKTLQTQRAVQTRRKNGSYTLSSSTKLKISKNNRMNDVAQRKHQSEILKGRKFSDSHKRKISEGYQKHFADTCKCWACKARRGEGAGKNNSFYGKKHSDESLLKIQKSSSCRLFPFSNTSIEVLLQKELMYKKIAFETNVHNIRGIPDIFVKPNICIFADGCYWHSCSACGVEGDVKRLRDKTITELLIKEGYRVFRFWEHDIRKDANACIGSIDF